MSGLQISRMDIPKIGHTYIYIYILNILFIKESNYTGFVETPGAFLFNKNMFFWYPSQISEVQ